MREAAAILADRPMRAVAKGTANMAKSVEIQIALADLEFLKANQYQLCFARMVNGAYTVVWQSYGGYLSNNPFSWLPLYQLFGTNTFTVNGGEVTIDTNAVSIDLGEQAVLNPDGNMEPAVTGGPADGITMINQYGPIHPGLIGVSTGGPAALAALLPALPADLNAPVLIVQHMPPMFTKALAASLARKTALNVKEAQDGEIAAANCIYLAPGGAQMKVVAGPRGETVLRITDDPPENGCKPAVDYLFRSAALQFPGRAVAAILTGMGNDGTAGLRLLKRGGCRSIAQDEATCVVFGMPKEAIATGLIDTVAPLDRIAAAIVRSVREGGA